MSCHWRSIAACIVLCLFGWLTNVGCSVADAIGGPGKVSGATKTGRVDKRFNAWGSDAPDITEELKAQGLVEYDKLTGEDIRKVQRQQFNNWFQQRAGVALIPNPKTRSLNKWFQQ